MGLWRKGATVLGASWAVFPLQLLSTFIVVRVLGAEAKGLLVLLTSATAVVAMVGQFGYPAGAIFMVHRRGASARAVLSYFALPLTVVLAAAVLSFPWVHPLLTRYLLGGFVIPTPLALGLVVLLASQLLSGFATSLVLSRGGARQYAHMTVIPALINAGATALLVMGLRAGVGGALAAVVLGSAAGAGIGLLFLLRGDRGSNHLCWADWRELTAVSAGHFAGTVGSQVFKRFDAVVLGLLLDPRAVGIYSIAMTAHDGALSIARAASGLLAGKASSMPVHDLVPYLRRAAGAVTAAMASVALAAGIAAIWAVPWLFGPPFEAAVRPLQVLLAAATLIGASITVQTYFLAVGRPFVGGLVTLLSGALNLGLSLWLIPLFGLNGNALATLLAAAAGLALNLLAVQRMRGAAERAPILRSAPAPDLREQLGAATRHEAR